MARQYGRLYSSIWDDDDYKALGLELQGLMNALIAYPKVSWCGIIDYIPKRLMKIDPELTEASLWQKLARLHNHNMIQIDTETDEMLIRRLVKYDGVMKHPNVAKAMAKATQEIESQALRGVLMNELGRLLIEEPDLEWEALRSGFGDVLEEIEQAAEAVTERSRRWAAG
jgi:hypothetical protein